MRYIKLFESFDNIVLKNIPVSKSMFGRGYSSPYLENKSKFLQIVSSVDGLIGEFEWGVVDNNTVEIISMFIEKKFRGNKRGRKSFEQFVSDINKSVILKVTKQSKGYWTHMGFKLIDGTKDYYKYEL